MLKESCFGTGIAHEFFLAAGNAGFTSGDVSVLIQDQNLMRDLFKVARGRAEIAPLDPIIDLEESVNTERDLKSLRVISNTSCGEWVFNPDDINYQSGKTLGLEGYITVLEIISEIGQGNLLPASVLNFLIKPENHEHIPSSWKGQYVVFGGTLFCTNQTKYFEDQYAEGKRIREIFVHGALFSWNAESGWSIDKRFMYFNDFKGNSEPVGRHSIFPSFKD